MKIGKRITDKSLSIYLNEIAKIPILTYEGELALFLKIKKGNREALDRLISSNLKFVVRVANEYRYIGIPASDLINEGNLGLLRAVKSYNPDRGIRFMSYAVWWVRQYILKAISEQKKVVRLPMSENLRIKKVTALSSKLLKMDGREPTVMELCKKLHLNKEEVLRALNEVKSDLSIDTPIGEGERSTISDMLTSEFYPPPDEEMDWKMARAELEKAIRELPKREAKIVALYFGVCGEFPHTLQEIGDELKISREGVRQIKEKALQKLRKLPDSKKLRLYLK